MPPGAGDTIDINKGMEHLSAARAILEPRGPSHALGFVHLAIATGARMHNDAALGIDACERALAINEQMPHPSLRVGTLAEYGLHLLYNGRVGAGREALVEAVEIAKETQDPWLIFHSSLNSHLFGSQLYAHEAIDIVDDALCHDAIARAPALAGFMHLNRVISLWAKGQIEEARKSSQIATELLAEMAPPRTSMEAAWETRFDEARALIAENRAGTEPKGFMMPVINGLYCAGWIGLYEGDHEYGRTASAEMAAYCTEHGGHLLAVWGLAFLVLLDALDGRTEASDLRLAQIHQIIDVEECRGLTAFVRMAEGVHAAARGADGAPFFTSALDGARAEEWVFLEAEVLHRWGVVVGDDSKLHDAIAIFDRIGAPPFYADRVRADLPT